MTARQQKSLETEAEERARLTAQLKGHPELFGYHETSGHGRTLEDSFKLVPIEQLRKMAEKDAIGEPVQSQ